MSEIIFHELEGKHSEFGQTKAKQNLDVVSSKSAEEIKQPNPQEGLAAKPKKYFSFQLVCLQSSVSDVLLKSFRNMSLILFV